MSGTADLAPNDLVATLPPWAQARFGSLQAELKLRELKIQQLTLELAHHKRLRFGVKSEALSPEQRDLFHETVTEDGAAIAAQLATNRPRAPAPSAGATWSRSARMSASSSTWSRRAFSSIATFALSMPAAPARR